MGAWKWDTQHKFLRSPGEIVERNKERIAGITDFHSIKAGMPICTESDANIIFEPILSYIVEYEDNVLESPLENNWALQVAKIESTLLNASNDSIAMFDREYLMKFFIALDWRGFSSNQFLKKCIKI